MKAKVVFCLIWLAAVANLLVWQLHTINKVRIISLLYNQALNTTEAYNITSHEVSSPLVLSTDDFDVLLTVNYGYYEFFLNWLHFYQKLQLPNKLIVVAEDKMTYYKLLELWNSSDIEMTIEQGNLGLSTASYRHKSQGYYKLVSSRPSHILRHLLKQRNVLYTDTDTVWRQNPFPYFVGNDIDMWALNELYDRHNHPQYCSGFISFRANNRTIDLMSKWQNLLQKPKLNQPAFNQTLFTNVTGVRIGGLSSTHFVDGRIRFSNLTESQKRNVAVLHNSWVIGHAAKKSRFIEDNLWYETVQS